MTQRKLAVTALLALALAACQQPANDSNIAIDNGPSAAAASEKSPPPSEQASTPDDGFNVTSSKDGDTSAGMPILPEDLAKATIPAPLHGRWGMVAADCTSTRGDAKGLITIAERTLRLYESTATLKAQRPSTGTSFKGLFGFTGEGQTWERVMTLTRTRNRLTRADQEGSFTYTRC